MRLPASHSRAKAIIAACADAGVGIEYLPDAPRFRFYPTERSSDPRKGRETCKPSGRGTFTVRPAPKHIKNWTPAKLDLNPNYMLPMRGDSKELTKARAAWHRGDPKPLREWLAKQ